MRTFDIQPTDKSLKEAVQAKIDNLNKPKGSLGRLEELAMQVCLIQQTLEPSLAHPCHLLLGGRTADLVSGFDPPAGVG